MVLWQVLFLLYHYFEAREMYNAIRIFIAGYVWMTGYNNFSYYYKYKVEVWSALSALGPSLDCGVHSPAGMQDFNVAR